MIPNDDVIARRKFEMLMQAVEQVNKQDEAMAELRDAAFEVLHLHPGIGRDEWVRLLLTQYGTEVLDALGTDPPKVCTSLVHLWTTPYRDEASGLERTYDSWAKAFATEEAVQMYYDLIERT